MTMIEVPAVRGRAVKFTPERIEQIKNLVERGVPREEIAAMIDVTVGSLQVTCSRLGISLRRPRSQLAGGPMPPKPSQPPSRPTMVLTPGNGTPRRFTLGLVVRNGSGERINNLALTDDIITRLALDATIKGMTIAEFISHLLTEKYK